MDRNTVEIAWIAVDAVAPGDWPRLERRLDATERERAARFRFARDRHSYVAGHALVRTMLSRHAAVRPEDWRFTANAYGRPEIDPAHQALPLRFSLSHTHGMAAVAVTLENDVGLDVESLHRSSLTLALADRFFAPAEAACLASLPPERLNDALYAFWTLKEAYIKAVGLGLSLPLDAFAFTLDPLAIAFSERIDDDPADWLFRRLTAGPAYVLALALRHPDAACVRVDVRPATLEAMLE